MPAFRYSNPEFGVGISNLAEALIGTPGRDVQLGLLGDRRRTEQVQRRKLEAEALSKEIHNREQEAAYEELDSTVGALVGAMGLQDPQQNAGASAGFRHSLRMGGNAAQTAKAMQLLTAMGLAGGGEDQMRRSLVVQGRQPTDDFAGTTGRADSLIADAMGAALTKATTVAGMNNKAATERALVLETMRESGRDARHVTSEAGKDRRAKAKGDKSKTPLKVGASEMKAINEGINTRAQAALGGTHADEVVLDPATRTALVQGIAELFQNSRNLPGAIEGGWAQVMGLDPNIETSGNWNPFAADTATISPQQQGEQAIIQARDAIARGADPKAVAARLQQMGIDPSGL